MDRGRVTFYFFRISRGKTGIRVDSTFRQTSLHTWQYLFYFAVASVANIYRYEGGRYKRLWQ